MRVGAAVAVVLLSVIVTPAHGSPPEVDTQRLFLFAELLERAKHLPQGRESAAFVVRDSHHDVYLVRWPESGIPRQTTYRGAIPAGTIAIAHTHPELAHLRMPSAHDAFLARQTGLDVYVITRAEIWLAEGATGKVTRVVSNGSWSARTITRVSRPATPQPHAQVASSPDRSRKRDSLQWPGADE